MSSVSPLDGQCGKRLTETWTTWSVRLVVQIRVNGGGGLWEICFR